jgi:pimeloyl-ACP methyl ester carboxylesterase
VVPGGHDHWLPLIAVDDLARLTVALAVDPGAAGRTVYALDRDGPHMAELLRITADQLRQPRPAVSVPAGIIRSGLRYGGSTLTGIAPESLDFVTTKQFPDAVSFTATREILPSVVADLDYRLARRGLVPQPASLTRTRLGDIAALIRPGTGVPWVIIHGLFSSADEMIPLARGLEDGPVYVLDLPGFGRSPLPARDTDLFSAQVEAVAAALGCLPGPVRLAGHSYGALVAGRVAALHPDRVLALHLLQPPLHRPRLPWSLSLATGYPRLTRRLLRVGVTPSSLAAGFRSRAEMPEGYAARVMADMTSPRVRHATADAYRTLGNGYTGIALADIKPPVHLVWGNADASYPVVWAEQAALKHGHVRLSVLPYGHQFPLSHAPETAAALHSGGTGHTYGRM